LNSPLPQSIAVTSGQALDESVQSQSPQIMAEPTRAQIVVVASALGPKNEFL